MTTWTAERVKQLRAKLGESQEEFAKHFRLTVDSIRTWEQSKGLPSGAATVVLDQLAGLIPIPSIAVERPAPSRRKSKELAGAK